MMKVLVGYPTEEEEFVIVDRVTGVPNDVVPMATTEQLSVLQNECRSVYVDPALKQYAVRLAFRYAGSRSLRCLRPGQVRIIRREPSRFDQSHRGRAGAGVPARTHLRFARGREDLVPDVFRHRLVLTYEALAEAMTADQLIHRIMQHLSAPDKPLETHVKVAAGS